jgi:hypothetical protein
MLKCFDECRLRNCVNNQSRQADELAVISVYLVVIFLSLAVCPTPLNFRIRENKSRIPNLQEGLESRDSVNVELETGLYETDIERL